MGIFETVRTWPKSVKVLFLFAFGAAYVGLELMSLILFGLPGAIVFGIATVAYVDYDIRTNCVVYTHQKPDKEPQCEQ